MKNAVLILMALLIVAMGYFLKVRSDQVGSLTTELATRETSLKELRSRLGDLDKKVAADETALRADESRLAATAAVEASSLAKLQSDLASAQQALSAEQARRRGLTDQESSLGAARKSADEPSLAGHIANDQLRLKQIDQQLKSIEGAAHSRVSMNKVEAKDYHAQMKATEKSLQQQISAGRKQIGELTKQISKLKKDRFNADRGRQAADLQTTVDTDTQSVLALEQQLSALRAKETSDSQSNVYDQEQKANYEQDQRVALQHERVSVQADLANLQSRGALVKRDVSDVSAQLSTLRAQEHESDAKIAQLSQQVTNLRAQIAAVPKTAGVSGSAAGAAGVSGAPGSGSAH